MLITGSMQDCTEKDERRIQSLADDILFCVTKGVIKPQKHIVLGMGIKSLTGSKKVVTLLNRFGHSINYSTVEELETTFATSIAERGLATPDGLLQMPGLATGLAFDNYDELTETLDGKDTLHDTVGIAYQNIQPALNEEEDELGESLTNASVINTQVEMYRPNIDQSSDHQPMDTIQSQSNPAESPLTKSVDGQDVIKNIQRQCKKKEKPSDQRKRNSTIYIKETKDS